MDFDKVQTIIRNIGRAIIVSSDNKVLEAYTFVERIDPRFAPSYVILIGREFKP
jgi:predicted RNase H-like nuclease (RuvC/YqgF family)